MNKLIIPFVCYAIICIIGIILPASEGYNTVLWKLFVSQIFAIPVFLIVLIISLLINRNKTIAH